MLQGLKALVHQGHLEEKTINSRKKFLGERKKKRLEEKSTRK